MAKKNNEFAAALKQAGIDRSAEVRTGAGQACDVLGKVNRSGLDPAAAQELAQLRQEVDRAETTYGQTHATADPQIAARAKHLTTVNTVRKLTQVLLLLLAVIVLFNEWWVAMVLLVVLIVGRLIARKWLVGQAQLLARQSTQPSAEALRTIGRPFGGLSDPSGLCARADALYWAGLDKHGKLLEQQRRRSRGTQPPRRAGSRKLPAVR
ncbi:hypothetical protein ACF3NT_14225 [Naumannella halotolerans]|uniref:hypothetical protein n=1 Tax=Naumannella halotolerans TaxID=993414 RepID=UPI00370D2A2B